MPAVISTSAYCCLNLQIALDGLVGNLAPDRIQENLGFIDAIRSGENTTGFRQVPTDSAFPGKNRPQANERPVIEIEYEKPECNAVTTNVLGLCGNQPARGDSKGYMRVYVNEVAATGGDFTKADFDELCEAPSQRLALRLRKEAMDLKRAINTRLIELAYAAMGNYADGDPSIGATTKVIPLLNGAGHINPAAMAVVKSQFRQMHAPRLPIMVGGDILGVWQDTRVMGGLGANAIGANPGNATGGVSLFVDDQLDSVVQTLEADAASHALSWVPGAFQMLEWYQNVGYWEELGKDDYVETTITIDGIRYDYTLNYDKCTHTYSYELSKHYDLFFLPDAAYQPCWDWNFRLHFELACGDFNCANYFLPSDNLVV